MLLCHNDSHSTVVELWPAGTAKHLHNFKVRVLLATDSLVLVRDSVLDDHHVTGQIDSDGKSGRAANNT